MKRSASDLVSNNGDNSVRGDGTAAVNANAAAATASNDAAAAILLACLSAANNAGAAGGTTTGTVDYNSVAGGVAAHSNVAAGGGNLPQHLLLNNAVAALPGVGGLINAALQQSQLQHRPTKKSNVASHQSGSVLSVPFVDNGCNPTARNVGGFGLTFGVICDEFYM